MLPVIGRRKVAELRKVEVQDVIDGLVARGLHPVTVQCAILPLRAIYARLLDRGDLAVNPTSPKALSTYKGHSSITITFDLYGHLIPGYMDEAAGMLDAYLARANTTARTAQIR